MELERIVASGLTNIYSLSTVQKEFRNSVNETWKDEAPYPRYQKKLLQDLAVLEDLKEEAITLPQFEKLTGEDRLYSIRHPRSQKSIRLLYTIEEGTIIILLCAFLEKGTNDYKKAIAVAKKRLKWLDDD